jgi:hypothetical protein
MKSRRFIALPFDALNHRVFAFASSAKRPNVSFGSKSEVATGRFDVRFAPNSGRGSERSGCPFCANNGSGAFLFKDLIRAGEKGRRDFDAKRFRGLEINSKQVLGGLFNR